MKVLITVDTEINPNEISPREILAANIDQRIFGKMNGDEVGIGYEAETLRAHGLTGVFFVESLCGSVIDPGFLRDWVQKLQSFDQEIQLHVHSEWAAPLEICPLSGRTGQNLAHFSYEDQYRLIGMSLDNLSEAGATNVCAFRAGNYGANDNTLRAVAAHGLLYDSSYNHSYSKSACEISAMDQYNQPSLRDGCWELPVTNFLDGFGKVRHAQLCASSASEMEEALKTAHAKSMPTFVIVSHSFELLAPSRKRASYINRARWESLLRFLSANRQILTVTGFQGIDAPDGGPHGSNDQLQVSGFSTIKRYAGQAIDRLF